MSFLSSNRGTASIPPPAPPPPPPTPTNPETAKALDQAAENERKTRGRAATLLTAGGGAGIQTPNSNAAKVLLAT